MTQTELDTLNAETALWLYGTTEELPETTETTKTRKQAEKQAKCPRCNGTGYIEGYRYHKGGVCFKCNPNV